MAKFEQAAPHADVSQPSFAPHEVSHQIETSRSAVTAARTTADDTAQKTVDNKFGTPEIEGLNRDSKPGDNTSQAWKDKAAGGEPVGGGVSNDVSIDGKTGSENPADGKASEQEMKSNGKAEEFNGKQNGKDEFKNEKTLNADELQQAGETGRLTEMLTKAGVDVNDPKALNAYLSRAFDNHIIQGLTLAGEKLPDNPTDADLGKALLPAVARSSETDIKQALEADPAKGYASIRDNFIMMQNRALANEK